MCLVGTAGLLTVGTPALASGVKVGLARVSATPSSVDFGMQSVSVASDPRTIRVRNLGIRDPGPRELPVPMGKSVRITSVRMEGENPVDFSITKNTCKGLLAPGESCVIRVLFAPTVAGSRSGVVTVVDSGVGGPHSVALRGLGFRREPG